MGFFKENKHANGTTSTDWGGSIAGGFGGVEGIAVAFMVFIGAIVGGGFALLWFAITGYKKFNLGKVSRIIALVLSIVYGYIIYATLASGKPDLMTLAYANIPIVIFFVITYLLSKRNGKFVESTVDNEAVSIIGRMSQKKFRIYSSIFMLLLVLVKFGILPYINFMYFSSMDILFIPIIYFSINRLHDIGKSAWWILVPSILSIMSSIMSSIVSLNLGTYVSSIYISIFDIIFIIIWIYLMITKGEESENKFGAVVV
jgi:uncharacterized membrane protein YhaH (DUF805 family)